MSSRNSRIITITLCLAVSACAAPGTSGGPGATAALPGTATISARALTIPITIGTSTRDEVAAQLGKTTSVRFDSGFEVWAYRLPGEPGDTAGAARSGPGEFVVLFTPSGVVAKTRFRPLPTGSGGNEGR